MLSILAYVSALISAALAILAVRGKTTETASVERGGGKVDVEVLSRKGKLTLVLAFVTCIVAVVSQHLKDVDDDKKSTERNQALSQQLYLSDRQLALSNKTIDLASESIAQVKQARAGLTSSGLKLYSGSISSNLSAPSDIKRHGLDPSKITYVGREFIRQPIGSIECELWIEGLFQSVVKLIFQCKVFATVVASGSDENGNVVRGVIFGIDGEGGYFEDDGEKPKRASLFDLENKVMAFTFRNLEITDKLKPEFLKSCRDPFGVSLSKGDLELKAKMSPITSVSSERWEYAPSFKGSFGSVW